jgi:hypothetical protein
MSDDCRNDCAEPVAFPKRPNNRPGLDKIDYRIGAYPDFRDYLLGRLDRAPLLRDWTHRGADDPGIALLEGAAILGDILSFYQDRYANEAYLRTATWRDSVADLVRLLGYRLSPGLGGRGTFAFEVKGDKPVSVPAGFPLTAQVEGLEDPADFMTSEDLLAYPWLGRFNLYRRLHTPYITSATKDFVVWDPDPAIEPIEIIAGDRLLIGIADSSSNPTALSDPEIVVIDSVRELHGRKIYTIKGELQYSGSSFQMAAVKLGRSFRHFGHNAPRKLITRHRQRSHHQLCALPGPDHAADHHQRHLCGRSGVGAQRLSHGQQSGRLGARREDRDPGPLSWDQLRRRRVCPLYPSADHHRNQGALHDLGRAHRGLDPDHRAEPDHRRRRRPLLPPHRHPGDGVP